VKITRLLPLLALLPLAAQNLRAQAHPAADVPVVMLSDIHLDPFHDPAKLPQLRSAPLTQWQSILTSSPSATQAADFDKLQSACHARGVDTPIALLESSLSAAHAQQPHPLFVTVSGDLMAHQFDCRFHTLAPSATEANYSAFAAKTVAFVALRLRQTFPHAPVYLALGNNDSGCKDYREDPDSAFLQADAQSFASAAAPEHDTINPTNRAAILHQFSQFGDYNITLPAPFTHTRLIVLQDIFDSARYTSCSNGDGTHSAGNPGALQMQWLFDQLTAARAAHEKVWVMAHIPPGIDAYSTIKQWHANACSNEAPESFIPSGLFAAHLTQFADVIKLVLLGHTHMDEFRAYASTTGAVAPGKLVPSITPVNGNNPAFTVAQVNPATATLVDYTVYSASTPPNWDTAPTWAEEYRYSTTYHLPDFSGTSAATLTSALVADKAGATPASQAYQQFYFVGEPDAARNMKGSIKAAAIKLVWPIYACSLANTDEKAFSACACAAHPQ
jgi:sphingomyelin phosphodiesterase acid-like 3